MQIEELFKNYMVDEAGRSETPKAGSSSPTRRNLFYTGPVFERGPVFVDHWESVFLSMVFIAFPAQFLLLYFPRPPLAYGVKEA